MLTNSLTRLAGISNMDLKFMFFNNLWFLTHLRNSIWELQDHPAPQIQMKNNEKYKPLKSTKLMLFCFSWSITLHIQLWHSDHTLCCFCVKHHKPLASLHVYIYVLPPQELVCFSLLPANWLDRERGRLERWPDLTVSVWACVSDVLWHASES